MTDKGADSQVEKNRISGIEPAAEDDLPRRQGVDKKAIIILSSIAAALLLAVVVLTQFVFKKPGRFSEQREGPGVTFDEPTRDERLASDNEHIKRGRESYARGYITDAISEFNSVVESDAPDRDKAVALAYLGKIYNERGEYDRAVEVLNRAVAYDKENPEIFRQLSMAYRGRREFDKALEAAEKSTAAFDKDIDGRVLTGNIYFETGRYDEAIAAYREALATEPENPRVLYNLGSALMKKGDEFAAVEYFKKAAAADRIGEIAFRAYSRLGVIYTERKNWDEAEKYLKEAVNIRPGDALNRYNLGIAYLRQNKTAEATAELSKAESLGEDNAAMLENIGEAYFSLKRYDKSAEIFTRLSRLNERNVRILSRLADIYYEKGELDQAYELYRRITTIEPATENARVAYLNMGNILDEMQRFDEAVEAYQKAIAISPKDAAAYYNMGIAYKHAGKPELAIFSWKKASELNPGDANPQVALADYYYERGFYDLAETEYRRIAARWPDLQEPHFKMGTMYYKRGLYDYAVRAFDKVMEIDSRSELARQALVNKALLITKKEKGSEAADQAMGLVRKALLMKPDDPESLYALGIVYMKKEMYDSAIDTFYQVVRGSSDNRLVAEAYHNIGKCHFKRRQYKKALQAFTRGIEEDPSNEELRMNRKAASQAYEAELGRD